MAEQQDDEEGVQRPQGAQRAYGPARRCKGARAARHLVQEAPITVVELPGPVGKLKPSEGGWSLPQTRAAVAAAERVGRNFGMWTFETARPNGLDEEIKTNVAGETEHYQGLFQKARRHGFGRLRNLNEHENYQGGFLASRRSGHGLFWNKQDEVYHGQWQNDCKHGVGVWRSATGDAYAGMWKLDQMTNFGIYAYSNGAVYHGFRKDGAQHGEGLFIDGDGNGYSGKWRRNARHGTGLELDLTNCVEREVRYSDGRQMSCGDWRALNRLIIMCLTTVDFFRRLPDGSIIPEFLDPAMRLCLAMTDKFQRADALLPMGLSSNKAKKPPVVSRPRSLADWASEQTRALVSLLFGDESGGDSEESEEEELAPSRYAAHKSRTDKDKIACNKAFVAGLLRTAQNRPKHARALLLDNNWSSTESYLRPAGVAQEHVHVVEMMPTEHALMSARRPQPGVLHKRMDIADWFDHAKSQPALQELRFDGVWLDLMVAFEGGRRAIESCLKSEQLADECFLGLTLCRRSGAGKGGRTPFDALVYVDEVARANGYEANLDISSRLYQGYVTIFWNLHKC